MRPELSVSSAEEIIARAWEKAPNRMILSSLTLAAVAYLDAVDLQPDCSMRNVLLYKQVALREIGLRLRTSATAISDETITCLGNVIAFEVRASGQGHGLVAADFVAGGDTKPRSYRTPPWTQKHA